MVGYRTLLVATALLATTLPALEPTKNSTVLEETLRRQLMADNYDYMPSSSDEAQPRANSDVTNAIDDVIDARRADDGFRLDREDTWRVEHPGFKLDKSDDEISKNDRDMTRRQYFSQDTGDFNRRGDVGNSRRSQSVYTRDGALDQELQHDVIRDKVERANDSLPSGLKLSEAVEFNDITVPDKSTAKAAKKYKILRVRDKTRRSMAERRFIQEEGSDGVAILNLDQGPFPEFRLPRDRRQYMQVDYSELQPDPPLTGPRVEGQSAGKEGQSSEINEPLSEKQGQSSEIKGQLSETNKQLSVKQGQSAEMKEQLEVKSEERITAASASSLEEYLEGVTSLS